MAQSLLDILIRIRRLGQGEIGAAITDLKRLDAAAGSLSQGLAGLAAGAGVVGIAALASELDQLARRGAVFEQLGSVLGDFAGSVNSSADAMISAAKRAAQGTISEYELILNANRAIQFEVAKTPEQFAKLIELSTALGRAQGISDTQALEFITTGLARESRLILDNLGLIIDLDKATSDYAATLGKTADQLTQSERKAALLEEAYRQGAVAIQANRDAADSAATQFERFDANVQNLKDNFGLLLAEISGNAIADLANVINDLTEIGFGGGRSVESLRRELADLRAERDRLAAAEPVMLFGINMSEQVGELGRLNVLIAELEAQLLQAAAAQRDTNDTQAEAAQLSFEAADAHGAQARAALEAANALAETERAAAAAGRAAALAAIDAGALTDELNNLAKTSAGAIVSAAKGVTDIVGSERAKELANQQLRFLQEQTLELQKQGLAGLDLTFAYEDIKNQSLAIFENIEEADRAAQRAARGGVSALNKAAQEAERAFDELKGKVAGVLSGALDPGVGVNPDEILEALGLRPDAINEDARRLADIAVRGFESPWLDYFRTEFPNLFQQFFAGAAGDDGIKAQAAQLLKNFQDGLNPELLDKDTAKERVRRLLIGEARMDELAQEIAQELAGEFGGVSQARIASLATSALGGGSGLLGTPDRGTVAEEYGGVGATAAEAFSSGARGAVINGNLGGQITAALDEQLRAEANLARLTEGGRISGAAWGNGFLDIVQGAVPARLIEILSQLVAPGVENILDQRATLRAAR